MKTFFILVLALGLLLMLFGCQTTANTPSTGLVSNPDSSDILSDEGDSVRTGNSSQLEYLTFEETLASATNIVVATYTGEFERNGIYDDLVFLTERSLKGTDIGEAFHVRLSNQAATAGNTDLQVPASPDSFVQGEKCCLILEKHISVYNPYDVYVPLHNVLMQGDQTPTMYTGSSDYADGQSERSDFDTAIASIEALLARSVDTSKVAGREFIRSDDVSEIAQESSSIAEVVPIALKGSNENNHTERYACSVQSVLKGKIPESDIEILFMAGTVEVGKTYTVMLENPGSFVYYVLSSKNSVYRSDDALSAQIKRIVEESLSSDVEG